MGNNGKEEEYLMKYLWLQNNKQTQSSKSVLNIKKPTKLN